MLVKLREFLIKIRKKQLIFRIFAEKPLEKAKRIYQLVKEYQVKYSFTFYLE